MNIRPAAPADLPAILEIYNHEVLHSTCTADYEPRLLEDRKIWYCEHVDNDFPVLVAETAEGVVAGWSSLSPYKERYAYRFTGEDSVYIAEQHRGRGLGKKLLAPLIESAREMGLHAMIGAITSDNEASIRLHAGFGFVEKGRLPEIMFKFDRWLDVVYMELML